MNPPPITMKALLTFLKPKTAIKLKMAITAVRQSDMLSLPISIHTAKMTATAAIFTASKKAEICADFLNFGIRGFNISTNKNEGRNMPIVAATAPVNPCI